MLRRVHVKALIDDLILYKRPSIAQKSINIASLQPLWPP